MAKLTCAISGIRFDVSHLDSLSITHAAGYYHPIFAVEQKDLYLLYSLYGKHQLPPVDSYLLFCAFLNSSGYVTFNHPVTLNPHDSTTKALVANNIAQLVRVIEQSNLIRHPAFEQPCYKVYLDNSHISTVTNWILAWEANLEAFNTGLATKKQKQDLLEIENRLTLLIKSGETMESYSHVVANWAEQAAEFPPNKVDEWKRMIRSCFNSTAMFKTKLSDLTELKEYCESNIAPGSIHYHALMDILREGIKKHTGYLGYTLLGAAHIDGTSTQDKEAELVSRAELEAIAARASDVEPKKEDYPTSLAFLKARLAYKAYKSLEAKAAKEMAAPVSATTTTPSTTTVQTPTTQGFPEEEIVEELSLYLEETEQEPELTVFLNNREQEL